jgi:ADP-ribose pyrophosphatase YjhB (NUDIX family)
MEEIWLGWAKRISAIASTGIHFSRNHHDLERYQELQAISMEMLARLGNVPIGRIEELVAPSSRGYETPKVDVRGAVFSHDRILLVQEVSDGLWTLPGGYADVGCSPGENVIAEVWEEAGLRVVPKVLYAVRHKAKHAYPPDVRDFYKLFFICDLAEETDPEPTPGAGILAAGYFARDSLPPLSTGRVLAKDIHAAYLHLAARQPLAEFD